MTAGSTVIQCIIDFSLLGHCGFDVAVDLSIPVSMLRTDRRTVNDISPTCLSACGDKNVKWEHCKKDQKLQLVN